MSELEAQHETMSGPKSFRLAREAVLQTCRMLADMGFLAGTGGNVALRADNKHFCVTPSATDYYTMTPEDVCVGATLEIARQRATALEHACADFFERQLAKQSSLPSGTVDAVREALCSTKTAAAPQI